MTTPGTAPEIDDASISPALRTLLAEIIDYAGLFPPAALDMDATVLNYDRAIVDRWAWMIGRLVVPVDRLGEFEQAARHVLPTESDRDPWPLSVLVAPAGDPKLPEQLDLIREFNQVHAEPSQGLAFIDVVELRGDEAAAVDEALDHMPETIFPYFELPLDHDPRGLIATLTGVDAGAKARTGGVEPQFYPEPEHLARFIAACAAGGVPFKATAGLHHPLRHRATHVDAEEFGFLNVFVGALLAYRNALDEAGLRDILVEPSIDAFSFTPSELRWRDQALPLDDVEDGRLMFALSFGSCSIDEPVADLQDLGLFPRDPH